MSGLPEAVINQKPPIGRPTCRALPLARLVQQLLLPCAVRGLLVQVINPAPVGRENDAASIRRPNRERFPAGIRRKSSSRPTREIQHPDIPILCRWIVA